MGLASVDMFIIENDDTGELVGLVFRESRAKEIVEALEHPFVYRSAKEFLSGIEWKALKAVIRWLKKLLDRKKTRGGVFIVFSNGDLLVKDDSK